MERRGLIFASLIAAPLFIAIMIWPLIMYVDEGDWLSIILGGLGLGVWVLISIYNYRWLRWTSPLDSNEIAPSDV